MGTNPELYTWCTRNDITLPDHQGEGLASWGPDSKLYRSMLPLDSDSAFSFGYDTTFLSCPSCSLAVLGYI
jgi:hypothetical protein